MKALLLSFFLLGLAICGSYSHLEDEGVLFREKTDLMKLKKKNFSKISVFKGQKFVIDLPSNPTTGYNWHLKKFEHKDIESLDKTAEGSYIAPDSKLMGAPGRQVFEFVAKHAGEAEIKLAYYQEWKPNEIAYKYEVLVNIYDQQQRHCNCDNL